MKVRPLSRSFYLRPTLIVAKDLLGKYLVKDDKVGLIVETEAYIGVKDKASHASWRKKEKCLPMWGIGGYSYVYLIYGMYYMFNVVTEDEGKPCAVLIRALEPVMGINKPTNGPGRLTKALGLTIRHNNLDLTKDKAFCITESLNFTDKYLMGLPRFKIARAKRIGIDYAGSYAHKLWRFYIKGNKYVSKI